MVFNSESHRNNPSLIVSMSFVFFVVVLCAPFGNGHLASLFDDGKDVVLGGYTFRVHPKKGEAKSPIFQHSREARGPLLSSFTQEGLPLSSEKERLSFLKPPSYQHKNFYSNRIANFHQNGQPVPSSSRLTSDGENLFKSGDDAHFQRFLSNFAPGAGQQGTATGEAGSSKEHSTFTPYISARALSNMEKFFHHLRENLEALQNDEDTTGTENRDVGVGRRDGVTGDGHEEHDDSEPNSFNTSPEAMAYLISHSSHEWKPMASGVLGLKKIRSFFPLSQNSESRTRLGTNLGLGKK